MSLAPEILDTLRHWMNERDHIRELKEGGAPKPWTPDPILRHFRFCNVRREDDKVTRWFAANWRKHELWCQKNFVPAMIFGRIINWPDTLQEIGFPYIWNSEEMLYRLDRLQGTGAKVYTGAYIIRGGPKGVRKNAWIVQNADNYFFSPPQLDPLSLANSAKKLQEYYTIGPFLAGQVIADLKYTSHLREAKDWWTWAILGPGSTKGLNRLHNRAVTAPIAEAQGLEELQELEAVIREWGWKLHMQDVQNCLCELDKYLRIQNVEGRPRANFPGT